MAFNVIIIGTQPAKLQYLLIHYITRQLCLLWSFNSSTHHTLHLWSRCTNKTHDLTCKEKITNKSALVPENINIHKNQETFQQFSNLTRQLQYFPKHATPTHLLQNRRHMILISTAN